MNSEVDKHNKISTTTLATSGNTYDIYNTHTSSNYKDNQKHNNKATLDLQFISSIKPNKQEEEVKKNLVYSNRQISKYSLTSSLQNKNQDNTNTNNINNSNNNNNNFNKHSLNLNNSKEKESSSNNVFLKIVDFIINDEKKNNNNIFSKDINKDFLPTEAKINHLKKLENLNKEREKEQILNSLNNKLQEDSSKNNTIISKLRDLHNKEEELKNESDIINITMHHLSKSIAEIQTDHEFSELDLKMENVDSVPGLLRLMNKLNQFHKQKERHNTIEEIGIDLNMNLNLNSKQKSNIYDGSMNNKHSHGHNSSHNNNNNINTNNINNINNISNIKTSNFNHNHNYNNHRKNNKAQNQELLLLKQKFLLNLNNNCKDLLNCYRKENIIINFLKESLWQDNIQCENNIEITEKAIKLITDELILHYHKLLLEGKDTREKGLTWIIQSIWGLGADVIISYLPKYLDEKLINYLFLYSHKSVELKKVRDLLEEIKARVKHYNGIKVRNRFKKQNFSKQAVR